MHAKYSVLHHMEIEPSIYNNRIVNLARGVAYVCGGTSEGRAQAAGADDDGRRPAAGGGRGRGWRRASQNRDVTPGSWLTGVDGQMGGYKSSRHRTA